MYLYNKEQLVWVLANRIGRKRKENNAGQARTVTRAAASQAAHRRVPFGHLPGASRARARSRPRGQARATLEKRRSIARALFKSPNAGHRLLFLFLRRRRAAPLTG